jgi:hypothetical protein
MTKLEQMLLNGNSIAIVSVFYFMMALCKMPKWIKVSNILKTGVIIKHVEAIASRKYACNRGIIYVSE